jgi:hypothetical protein
VALQSHAIGCCLTANRAGQTVTSRRTRARDSVVSSPRAQLFSVRAEARVATVVPVPEPASEGLQAREIAYGNLPVLSFAPQGREPSSTRPVCTLSC